MTDIQRSGQDLEFQVSVPMIDGEPFDMLHNDWDLRIVGMDACVEIQQRNGSYASTGAISANADISADSVVVYAKSSKVSFGLGGIEVEMTIYAPHEKFEDEIQVLKTLREKTDIMLV